MVASGVVSRSTNVHFHDTASRFLLNGRKKKNIRLEFDLKENAGRYFRWLVAYAKDFKNMEMYQKWYHTFMPGCLT